MKKIILIVIPIVLVLAFFFQNYQAEIPQVKTQLLTTGTVEALVANTRAGTLRSCQRSKLSLGSGGTVAELLVKNGDRVDQGQVLLRLWNKDQQARVQQAQAQRDSAKLAVQEICDSAAKNAREAQRQAGLAQKNLISEEALDDARTKADIATHSCDRAKVEGQAAAAQLALQQALLDQTQLVAPFAGVVAEINGEVGEFVTPSPPGVATPPAVDLIADDCLYVRAPIDEVDAAEIKVGMPARISLDAFRGEVFNAVVTRIAPYVQDYEKQARTVDVEARFDPLPSDISLLVGYSSDIEVITAQRDNVVRVPTEAIFDLDHVMVLNQDNVLEQKQFEVGLSNWTWTEAKSGLEAGTRVLLSLDTPGAEVGAEVSEAP